jgi:hypothetical protein
MKKAIVILTALFLVGFLASGASAITISYGGDLDGTGGLTTSNSNAIVEDFNDGIFNVGGPFGAVSGDSYAIVNGSVSGQYKAPGGTTSDYLTTPEPGDNDGTGYVTVDLTTAANYFGMYWGSIDNYNTLSFSYQGNKLDTTFSKGNMDFTGAEYVNFSDFTFDSFTLASTNFAFEVDNIAVAPVPEPGTFVLMGLGLAGLVGMRKKFRK